MDSKNRNSIREQRIEQFLEFNNDYVLKYESQLYEIINQNIYTRDNLNRFFELLELFRVFCNGHELGGKYYYSSFWKNSKIVDTLKAQYKLAKKYSSSVSFEKVVIDIYKEFENKTFLPLSYFYKLYSRILGDDFIVSVLKTLVRVKAISVNYSDKGEPIYFIPTSDNIAGVITYRTEKGESVDRVTDYMISDL